MGASDWVQQSRTAVAAAQPTSSDAIHPRCTPSPALQRLPHALLSVPWLRRPTLPGALYLLLSFALPAAGLAYLLAPEVCWVQLGSGLRRTGAASCHACRWQARRASPPPPLPLAAGARSHPPIHPPTPSWQYTLYHTLGYVYGQSTLLAWRAVGGGLLTVLPALTYTLKVRKALWWDAAVRAARWNASACASCLQGTAEHGLRLHSPLT